MINAALYRRELKKSWKTLLIFSLISTLYVVIIISMYDSAMQDTLDNFIRLMPGLMEAVGMRAGTKGLLGYMSSYLYGFILIVFPMVFSMMTANRLIARYVEQGSMASLVAAPVKRSKIALTQMFTLLTGIIFLVVYITLLELVVAESNFPGELDRGKLLIMNGGLLALHLFIGALAFFFSCLFSDTKYSIAFGSGIPAVMFIIKMLANVGGVAKNFKYATFFSLYAPDDLILQSSSAWWGILALALGSVILFIAAVGIFSRKDLHI